MMKGDLSEEVTIELNDEKLPALGSSGGFRESGLPRAKSQWWQQDGSVQGTERGILQGHEACIRTVDFVLNAIGNHRRVLKEA